MATATAEDHLTALRAAHKKLGDEYERAKRDCFRLAAALRKYVHCRHASIECFCTAEAKAALYETDQKTDVRG